MGRKESRLSNLFGNLEERMNHSKNFPARVIRTIMFELNLNLGRFNQLMHEWKFCKYSGHRDTPIDRTNAAGNAVKEIISEEPTWNAVMKFFKIIRCTKFEVTFKLHFTWRTPLEVYFESVNLPFKSYKDSDRPKLYRKVGVIDLQDPVVAKRYGLIPEDTPDDLDIPASEIRHDLLERMEQERKALEASEAQAKETDNDVK